MSYHQPDTGNDMNDYFSSLTDFVMLAPNILKATNADSFQIWLEKLEAIDRRALFLYLRQNKSQIPPEHLEIAQRRFVKKI